MDGPTTPTPESAAAGSSTARYNFGSGPLAAANPIDPVIATGVSSGFVGSGRLATLPPAVVDADGVCRTAQTWDAAAFHAQRMPPYGFDHGVMPAMSERLVPPTAAMQEPPLSADEVAFRERHAATVWWFVLAGAALLLVLVGMLVWWSIDA